ncbi:MAG: TolC family protein, partial [Comamonas sp.]
MARQQSWDVAAAVARVNQAAAGARQARAGLFPELTGSLNAAGYRRLDGAQHTASGRMGALLSASYEVDFWGRNRAFRDAAQSGLQASVFDRDTVQLTVTAGVADAWLQVVALRERIGIAQANLATAQRLLQLVESRVRWGAATPLELAQQRGLVAVQQRALASMQQQEADAQTALALWLGQAESLPLAQTSLTALQVPAIDQG